MSEPAPLSGQTPVNPSNLRSIVIGETALAVQCAQLLQSRGHTLVAVCSPEGAPLKDWAAAANVRHFAEIAGLTDFAAGMELDYLFSIVNYQVLPHELIRIAKIPINYHDGPLPRYAGVYATSWAIINGESQHGVTWHVMVDKVDAGDILQQRSVAVSQDDTVHSLNMKCYLAAYRAFNAMVPELASGSPSRTPQDLTARTYYGFSKWKSTAISWDWTAQRISRFCRALAFHPEPNPIGEAIADLNGVRASVQAAIPCPASGQPTGTIVEVADDYIQVAAAAGDVRLHGVRSLDGTPLDLASLRL